MIQVHRVRNEVTDVFRLDVRVQVILHYVKFVVIVCVWGWVCMWGCEWVCVSWFGTKSFHCVNEEYRVNNRKILYFRLWNTL